MPISLNPYNLSTFEDAIRIAADFKKVFGRALIPDFVAELCAARELALDLRDGPNAAGYDTYGLDGARYEIKYRAAQNVDVNSFDFDFLILVNLDDSDQLTGLWKLSVADAKTILVFRPNHGKYQTTQDKIKCHAKRLV